MANNKFVCNYYDDLIDVELTLERLQPTKWQIVALPIPIGKIQFMLAMEFEISQPTKLTPEQVKELDDIPF